jgi:AcrR family transcriptional regulator
MANHSNERIAGARREGILDAAELLVIDFGAAHLTMDAVAARARVSKGGLLHHFPTKLDLIKAMLDRLLAAFEADLAMIDRVAGPRLTDHLRAWLRLTQTINQKLDSMSAALLSASANDPALLAPFAAFMRERNERYRANNADFGATIAILAALDGFWLFNVLGLNPIHGGDADAFFAALERMIDDVN